MDNRYFDQKNSRQELNYASKFKNESADAPKVLRSGQPVPPPPQMSRGGDFYALRAEMVNRDNNSQLLFLQNEVARLREEINRQNQKNELKEELGRLKEELVSRARPEPGPVREPANDAAAERELASLIAELKRSMGEQRLTLDEESREAAKSGETGAFARSSQTMKEPLPAGQAESPDSGERSERDFREVIERLDAFQESLSERLREETNQVASEVLEKISAIPQSGAQADSIIDTNSIMQSTLLDEILYLKKVLEEESVTKADLAGSVDRILEQFRAFLEEQDGRSREAERERDQYLSTQFSLLYEMLAYNFDANSQLIGNSKESIEQKIQSLGLGIDKNSSAAADLVIKLTKIISILGVQVGQEKDVVAAVRDQLDSRFQETESVIRREIKKLSVKLANLRSFEQAEDGVDMLAAMGYEKLAELLGEKKAKSVFGLKERKDTLRVTPDVAGLAVYIKEKALLLQDYHTLVTDVGALKKFVANGVDTPAARDNMETILELPLDMLVDFAELSENFMVDQRELSYDSSRIVERIDGLSRELVSLRANHRTLFDNLAGAIREISAAVEAGAKSEELERINERMEKALPEELAALARRIDQGIKDNLLDKNETKVRLENLSFELSKLTEFSEISSILYDFKREVEDALEGNFHEFGAQLKGQVENLAKRVASSVEDNEIAVEVARLAQNVAISPNFDQTAVLEELGRLKSDIEQIRTALTPSVFQGEMNLAFADDAAYSEENK